MTLSSAIMCAEFDPTGRLVFAGTSLGYVLVFSTRTKRVCLFLSNDVMDPRCPVYR